MRNFVIAIVGASGAVGEEILKILDEIKFPIKNFILLASNKSSGKEVIFRNKTYKIEETTHNSFKGVDIAFFSAGSNVSKEFVPSAISSGALVIDNTSYYRMNNNVPLVVPEVNASAIKKHNGIIANPNCSTIQLVQILSPLHNEFNIERVDVSTYQAVSGAGKIGINTLLNEVTSNLKDDKSPFPYKIAFNTIPHIDQFLDNSYTKEEMKIINETHKIMGASFEISATCVRVPVFRSHSESVSIKFTKNVKANDIKEVLSSSKNVIVIDDIANNKYPMPLIATNTDNTYVGRIRNDFFNEKIIHLWCVADQIRVGAATNAVRIAKEWVNNL